MQPRSHVVALNLIHAYECLYRMQVRVSAVPLRVRVAADILIPLRLMSLRWLVVGRL